MTRIDPRREAGFTLVEMLVGLALLGMAAVLLMLGIARIGADTSRLATGEILIDEVADAQSTLRNRIERMMPVKDTQTAGATFDVGGDADSLSFIAAPPDRAGPDAPQRFRLRLDGNGNLMLYRLSTLDPRVDGHATTVDGWSGDVVLAGVRALTLRYYGTDQARGEAAWRNDWSHRPGLPLLVRVAVQFADGDRRFWPDLVIRPRAATPPACASMPCGDDGDPA